MGVKFIQGNLDSFFENIIKGKEFRKILFLKTYTKN